MITIFDAFCSNGSTWQDKKYFNSNNVIKNDIRNGLFNIYGQTINIITDTNYNMFDDSLININSNLVYLDPPFIIKNSNSIMFKKYTSIDYDNNLVPWYIKFDNMFYKSSLIAPITLLKFTNNDINIKDVLKIASKNYIIGIESSRNSKSNLHQTYMILLISKNYIHERG